MAKRQFHLTPEEITALKKAEKETRDTYELKRFQAVRLYGSGVPTGQIMELVGCDDRRIRDWCKRHREGSIDGLRNKWQGDNALKVTREQRADLKERLHTYRPDQVIPEKQRESSGLFWTVSDLHSVVKMWYGVEYKTAQAYHSLFKECGFSYQRTESSYRSKPDVQTVADFEAEAEKK